MFFSKSIYDYRELALTWALTALQEQKKVHKISFKSRLNSKSYFPQIGLVLNVQNVMEHLQLT